MKYRIAWLRFKNFFRKEVTRTVWLEYFSRGSFGHTLRIIKVQVRTNKCNEGLFHELRQHDIPGNRLNGVYSRRTATELLDGFDSTFKKEGVYKKVKRLIKDFVYRIYENK